MKSALYVTTSKPSGFACGVFLDPTAEDKAALARENCIKIVVAPESYIQLVDQLVEAGWVMSVGAKLNFKHQRSMLPSA